MHPRWCRISAINRITDVIVLMAFFWSIIGKITIYIYVPNNFFEDVYTLEYRANKLIHPPAKISMKEIDNKNASLVNDSECKSL